MTDKKVPLCVDCEHCLQIVYDGPYRCMRRTRTIISPVTGRGIHDRISPLCEGEREAIHCSMEWLVYLLEWFLEYWGRESHCGPEGRYFEPKKEER